MAVSSLLVITPPQQVHGAISACTVSMTPHQVDPGTSNTYQFQLTNNDPDTIQWIRIARPSNQFALTSASASGWSASLSSDNATFTGSGLDQGESLTFRVNAQTGASVNGTFNWSFFTSDDPSGSGQFACDGDLSVTVGEPAGPTLTISNLSVTGTTQNSVTVNWHTNVPARSRVNYGTTSTYGNDSGLTTTLETTHSVQLTGLSAATTYHYKVTSTPETGEPVSSGDNTFTTTASTVTGSGGGTNPPPIQKNSTNENTPPTIRLTSGAAGVYKDTPTFTGIAADNEAISRIEYSTDGGTTWLPVDQSEPILSVVGGRRVANPKELSFKFTPLNLQDGDYILVVRALDNSNSIASTIPLKLVIDRLAPQIGASMVSIGSQVLTPRQEGVITSIVGIEQKITMSAVGGPTSIVLTASVEGNPALTKTFSLVQDKTTGLWSGTLSFEHPAIYYLESTAKDGAGNTTHRALEAVHVAPSATVVMGGSNQPLAGTSATLYYFVPQTNSWAVWDGAAYGQPNPQLTDEQGRFHYFLPAGKYYLLLKKNGYKPTYSHVFNLDKPSPISATISMSKGIGFTLGKLPVYLPVWSTTKLDMNERTVTVLNKDGPSSLIGKQLPAFKLPTTEGKEINSLDLNGKPTVISLVAVWSPAGKEQLAILSELHGNTAVNVLPIVVQESTEKVNAYLNLANYQLIAAVDKNGVMIPSFRVQSTPMHLFVDRSGFVKKVVVGVLSIQEIKEGMGDK